MGEGKRIILRERERERERERDAGTDLHKCVEDSSSCFPLLLLLPWLVFYRFGALPCSSLSS